MRAAHFFALVVADMGVGAALSRQSAGIGIPDSGHHRIERLQRAQLRPVLPVLARAVHMEARPSSAVSPLLGASVGGAVAAPKRALKGG